MVGKEDLGLSLSLSSSKTRFPLHLNLMPSSSSSSSSPPPPLFLLHKTQWSDLLIPLERRTKGPLLRGIDMNLAPGVEKESKEEAAASSSPNNTISSINRKRSDREIPGLEEHEVERTSSRGISNKEDGEGSRKKLHLSKD